MIHNFFTIDHLLPYALVIYTEFEEILDGYLFKLRQFRKTSWIQRILTSK